MENQTVILEKMITSLLNEKRSTHPCGTFW